MSMKEPDWDAAEALLVEEASRVIEVASVEYASELLSFFAFSVDYSYGNVIICMDEYYNEIDHAKRHEADVLNARDTVLRGDRGWENARYYIERDRICSYNPYTSNFKYPNVSKIYFQEWFDYFDEELPESPDPSGRVLVLFHNVIARLCDNDAFGSFPKASPFRLGVEFPGDELGLVVMRLLNWPSQRI